MRSPNRKHGIPFLYKYLSAQAATAVLASQSLRYSSPLLFNDPFDVPREWAGITLDRYEEALVETFQSYLSGEAQPTNQAAINLLKVYEKRGRAEPEQFLQAVRFFFRLMAPELTRHLTDFGAAYRDLVPAKRILCFSEIPDSATMWAHYGQGHSGVVLEFVTSDERDSVWLMAQRVIYQDAKPRAPGPKEWLQSMMANEPIDWDEFFREYYLTKRSEWSYEREVRVVSAKGAAETGDYSDYVFHPADLSAVILGAKAHEETERTIRSLMTVKYPHTRLLRARIDQAERRIAIEPAT